MTTKAYQVAQIMRERIEKGEWKPRRRIPSQGELATEFRVSAHVVARAAAFLRSRGYLWTLPHKGSYARPSEDWRGLPE
jgi:DNA-binding GntR family transcriptional regulator